MKSIIYILSLCSINLFASTSLSWIYGAQNNSLNIKTETDQKIISKTKIGPSGGSISVTANDGSIFTLDIPENALLIDTVITMSPVTKMEGMTFGSNPLAVNFEPSGLVLRVPAILTIRAAKPIPGENQIFYNYEQSGNNLNLAIPVTNSREMKIKVFHFSGYGVTLGYMGDFDALRLQMGKNAGDKIKNALAEKLSKQRTYDLFNQDDNLKNIYPDMEEGLNEYYEKVLKERLELLNKSDYTCLEGRFAQESAISFTRNSQIAGFPDLHRELDNLYYIKELDRKCMHEEYLACRDHHIIHRLIPLHMMGIRTRHFAGQDDPQMDAEELDYINKCMLFEIEFNDITQSSKNNPQLYYTMFARYKIGYTDALSEIQGGGDLVMTNFSGKFDSKDCSMKTEIGPPGKTKVNKLRFVYGKKENYDPIGILEDIKLDYGAGNTNEKINITCQGHPMPPVNPMWFAFFVGSHPDEVLKTPDEDGLFGFIFKKFKINFDTELVAEKTWSIPTSKAGVRDEGSIRIYHKPR